jgi:tetratricopeptide (TPR) repeat protein
LELAISEGLISGLRAFAQTRLVQTSAAISPGSSGGGLFDAEGRLVGITTFFVKDGQNLNFALPGDWVRAVASHQVSPEEKTRTASQAFQALSWFQLGSQMLDAHEYEKAVSAFQEVLRLKPDDPDALAFLGLAYVHLGQHDQALRALRALQEAIRVRPDYVDAWFNLGYLYLLLNQFDDAIPPLQEAIRLKPDDADAWSTLGAAYGALGRQDQAIHAFQETIRLRPDDAKAWYGLGLLYSKQGNRSEVTRVYEKLKTLDQDVADGFLHNAVLPAGKDEK